MSLLIKFVATFAVVGLLISVVFGFVGGNRIISIVITSILCTIFAGGLGVAVYKILEIRVPEFLDLFQSDVVYDSQDADDQTDDMVDEADSFEETAQNEVDEELAAAASADTKTFGDHIIVGDIALKNEPSLMAAAIKTILARDDDS